MAKVPDGLPPSVECGTEPGYGRMPDELWNINVGLLTGRIPRHDEIPPSCMKECGVEDGEV